MPAGPFTRPAKPVKAYYVATLKYQPFDGEVTSSTGDIWPRGVDFAPAAHFNPLTLKPGATGSIKERSQRGPSLEAWSLDTCTSILP